jgi:uncharacterized membrane protein
VITIAVANLGGVRFPRWSAFTARTVYTLGLVFARWLFSQSMVVIGAPCPWCLLVTVSTTLVFLTLTHVNIRDGNPPLPPRVRAGAARFIEAGLDVITVTVWILTLILAIVLKSGSTLMT